MQKLNKADSSFITELIRSEDRKNPARLTVAIEIIRESGLLEDCRKMAREMVEDAWNSFTEYIAPSDSKILIRAMADYLTGNTNYH